MTYQLPRDMRRAAEVLEAASDEVAGMLDVDWRSGPVVWTADTLRLRADELEASHAKAVTGIGEAISEYLADLRPNLIPPGDVARLATIMADAGWRKIGVRR